VDKSRPPGRLLVSPANKATQTKNENKMKDGIEKQIEEVKKEIAKTHWTPKRQRLGQKLWNLQIKLKGDSTLG
jgi:hypothetical protein